MAKSSLNHCVRRVVKALCEISSDVIKWPHVTRMDVVTKKFQQIAGLQNVLGAIDGTHIEIPAPSVSPYSFICINNICINNLISICINLYR